MTKKTKTKNIFRKEIKVCADCGREMTVYIYADKNKNNRGGHYFGKIGRLEHWECPKCYWGKRNTKLS